MALSGIFGYVGALLMGGTLGMIGGGGSILTVPLLIFVFGLTGVVATYYSLFVVGLCAAVAVIPYSRRGLVEFRTALVFLLPSMAGMVLSRRGVLPWIPSEIHLGGISFSKDALILVSFATVMVTAAWSMIRKIKIVPSSKPHMVQTALNGLGVGILSGFVGAGGGFLIVPALVNGVRLSMEKAVGTSLFIIALNSIFGFAGDWMSGMRVDWAMIGPFSAIAVVGIFIGAYLNRFVPGQKLKPAFGWFVLVLGSAMLLRQLLGL